MITIMKKKNRSVWLITGVLIMLIAGTVYTWTIIARSIAATFPDWSAQTLSMTFTITMMGYAAGGMVSGVLLKKTGPKVILAAGAALFSGGMMLSSFAQSPILLYIGFGAMCGLATGCAIIRQSVPCPPGFRICRALPPAPSLRDSE